MQLPHFLIDHPDGEIRIRGNRIGLFDIVSSHRLGLTAEKLHQRFPTLDVPLIEQVLDFYRRNRAEVEAYVAREQAEIDRLRASAAGGPSRSELRGRLEAMKQAEVR